MRRGTPHMTGALVFLLTPTPPLLPPLSLLQLRFWMEGSGTWVEGSPTLVLGRLTEPLWMRVTSIEEQNAQLFS